MTQEEKKLLLKDLCDRLYYGVKCNVGEETPYTLSGIEIDDVNGHLFNFVEKKNGLNMQVYLSEVKPYLFPLSSMTEEQKKFLRKQNWCIAISKSRTCETVIETTTEGFDWLNKNHFDYRDLINMGLAKEATGLNIY